MNLTSEMRVAVLVSCPCTRRDEPFNATGGAAMQMLPLHAQG